ncbi:MAG TPA: peptidyl-alpha-hydroxyglycine alpha-amidating lyase family protein [Rhizomicrobium sp.]|nr:peptidyl-alpha-hydroxyglycine alpha-amidating lyase family protein [Rhizomicrobium sp.]
MLRHAGAAALATAGMLALGIQGLNAEGSPSPQANGCGAPPAAPPTGQGATPIFPPGQYPVKLPSVSLLGAPNDLPNPYGTGADWGTLPAGRVWGSTASVTTGPDGTIWVVDRCGHSGAGGETCSGGSANINPIFQFDTSGKLLKSFGAGLFVSPHKLAVDKDGNVWVADNGGNQVFKLDPNGKVLMTLGKKGVAGSGNDEFDQPTDVAFGANGTFFVADGHDGGGMATGNARVMKFDKDGKFLMSWGKKGMGPGEFDMPHALAMDSKGLLYVADRQNNRISVFDQNGKFIKQLYQFGRPSGIHIDKNDMLYSADSESRDGRTNIGRGGMASSGYGFNLGAARGIRIGSLRDGKVRYLIPDNCPYPYNQASELAEGVTTDAQGNVYGADFRGDVRKFTKQ